MKGENGSCVYENGSKTKEFLVFVINNVLDCPVHKVVNPTSKNLNLFLISYDFKKNPNSWY